MDDTLADAVTSGRRPALEAIRDRLAACLAFASPSQAPALTRELRAVIRELDELPHSIETSPVDDLTAARAKRQAVAAEG